MTVLIDTNVLYADHDTDATRHADAAAALEAVYDGELGQPYLSDYSFAEAITLTRTRTGVFAPAHRLSKKLRGTAACQQVYVSAAAFDNAVEIFKQYDDHTLSFTDATIVAVMQRRGIEQPSSFDDGFDGIVSQIPPTAV
jgi:predicted nucleic acid-binding protein